MKIGLFIPCYVDALYPEVGVATYKLLTHLGLDVDYPEGQTCCGQPMANGGFEKMSVPLAEKFEEKFKGFDYVVAPSVSCTAFIRVNYERLLAGHECETAKKAMDVVEFLHDVLKVNHPLGTFPHKVSLHNSCHGVRELGSLHHQKSMWRSSTRLRICSRWLTVARWWSRNVLTSAAVLVVCSPWKRRRYRLRWARTNWNVISRRVLNT